MAPAKPQMMPVYDETGTLIGLIDPAQMQKLAQPPTAKRTGLEAKHAAAVKRVTNSLRPQAGSDGQPVGGHPDGDQAADEIEAIHKALDNAQFSRELVQYGLVNVAKAAGSGDAYDVVVKAIDTIAAGKLNDAVALAALRISTSRGVPMSRAVAIAKQAAVRSPTCVPGVPALRRFRACTTRSAAGCVSSSDLAPAVVMNVGPTWS